MSDPVPATGAPLQEKMAADSKEGKPHDEAGSEKTVAETKADVKTDKEGDLKSEKDGDIKSDKDSDLKSDKEVGLQSDKDHGLKSDTERHLKDDKEGDLKTDKEGELKSDKETDINSDKESDIKSDKDVELKNNKDGDAHSHSDPSKDNAPADATDAVSTIIKDKPKPEIESTTPVSGESKTTEKDAKDVVMTAPESTEPDLTIVKTEPVDAADVKSAPDKKVENVDVVATKDIPPEKETESDSAKADTAMQVEESVESIVASKEVCAPENMPTDTIADTPDQTVLSETAQSEEVKMDVGPPLPPSEEKKGDNATQLTQSVSPKCDIAESNIEPKTDKMEKEIVAPSTMETQTSISSNVMTSIQQSDAVKIEIDNEPPSVKPITEIQTQDIKKEESTIVGTNSPKTFDEKPQKTEEQLPVAVENRKEVESDLIQKEVESKLIQKEVENSLMQVDEIKPAAETAVNSNNVLNQENKETVPQPIVPQSKAVHEIIAEQNSRIERESVVAATAVPSQVTDQVIASEEPAPNVPELKAVAVNESLDDWDIPGTDDEEEVGETIEGEDSEKSEKKKKRSGVKRGRWEPPPEVIVELYRRLDKEGILELSWKCPGRRPPSEEGDKEEEKELLEDVVDEEDMEISQEEEDPTEFDFDIDKAIEVEKFTPRRGIGLGQAQGSGKKRVARMDKVLNDIFRHRKIDSTLTTEGSKDEVAMETEEAMDTTTTPAVVTPSRPLDSFHIRSDLE